MTDLNSAYQAIPGYAEELEFQRRLRGGIPIEPAHLEEALEAFSAAYRDAILAGGEAPLDAAEAVLAARRQQEIVDLFNEEYKKQRTLGKDRLANLLNDGSDAAFTHLATELDTLAAEIRALTIQLNGNTTAADVLASGNTTAINAWQQLGTYADRYDKLRIAQQALLKSSTAFADRHPRPNEVLYSTVLYRNAIDVSTFFLKKRQDAGDASTQDTAHTRWLQAARGTTGLDSDNSWWPGGDRTEAIVKIFTQGEPWIPNPTLLDAAHTTALRAILPVRSGLGGRLEGDIERVNEQAVNALEEHRHHTHGEPLNRPTVNTGNLSEQHHKIAKKINAQAAAGARAAEYDQQRRAESEARDRARRP